MPSVEGRGVLRFSRGSRSHSDGPRRKDQASFFQRRTPSFPEPILHRQRGESPGHGAGRILVDIEVPAISKGAFCTYSKYRIRKSIDFPLASVATLLTLEGKERICSNAKVVIGSVGSRPEEVKEIGTTLKGKKIDDSLVEEASDLAFKAAKPIANVGGPPSPSYRRMIIRAFVRRSFNRLLQDRIESHFDSEVRHERAGHTSDQRGGTSTLP